MQEFDLYTGGIWIICRRTNMLQCWRKMFPTSTPFRLRPEGSVDLLECSGSGGTAVLDRWSSVSLCIGGSIAHRISESAGGMWSRVAHVCVGINRNYRWRMIPLRTFRKCSILQPDLDEPVRNFQKLWKRCQDASKMIDLQLGAPTRACSSVRSRLLEYDYV